MDKSNKRFYASIEIQDLKVDVRHRLLGVIHKANNIHDFTEDATLDELNDELHSLSKDLIQFSLQTRRIAKAIKDDS